MKRKPRIAVYARHSSDKQNPLSSADQAASCMPLVARLDGNLVSTHLDEEVSGYRRNRPGLVALLQDIRSGKIDIVVSEALDRLARDGEDISWLGKKLKFDHVRLHTINEGEIDDVKLAVAAMLGSMFLSNLQTKTLRGMEAAVLAGRFAGGRAYGYRKVAKIDDRGEPIAGLLEVDPDQAIIVATIFDQFAGGQSAIQIAKGLNERGIPGPRGGQWNASTIRGDPKKCVGILNNPLYRGELIWKRREWRKNPDSDLRERQYRLRDRSEWVRVQVPDLRIIDETQWESVRHEIDKRSLDKTTERAPASTMRRRKHLLSGLIKCGECGSNYVISGKDYYRCAAQKERGTCENRAAVRQGPLEEVVLSVLEHDLISPTLAELFVTEFRKQTHRLQQEATAVAGHAAQRLAEIKIKIETLARNMLVSDASPTLHRLLSELEDEKSALEERHHEHTPAANPLPPHHELLELFRRKVSTLRTSLNDHAVRAQASEALARLIHSVTIYSGAALEAEVSAEIADLVQFAAAKESSPRLSLGGCSVSVVAGVGFEPTTFRL